MRKQLTLFMLQCTNNLMNMMIAPQTEDTSYIDEITGQLRDLLRQVIKVRAPSVLAVLDDAKAAIAIPASEIEHALQVIGIWLQLMNIAEENAAVRNRRAVENKAGPDDVAGSLSQALGQAAASGVKGEQVAHVLNILDVGPTITAHPTEAKRVTVLEIHRRIYLILFELDNPRWTPRERDMMLAQIRNEIDLLWLTGDVRAEKPTVENEVAWGLHFFRDALFDRTTALTEILQTALQRHYPEQAANIKPPLKFSSWIGGDRDGNPFVTVATTRAALKANARASVQRLENKLKELARYISISSAELKVPANFEMVLTEQLTLSGNADHLVARNFGEPFRQYFSALHERLESTFEPGNKAKAFASVEEFTGLLMKAEVALGEMKAPGLATSLIRPLRWEAEIFGFRTASLDLRQNTTVTNRVLAEIWRKMNPLVKSEAPVLHSADWSAWIRAELEKPMAYVPQFRDISPEAQELLGLLHLIRETLDGPDPKAIGTFILSMTQSADDVLGLYVLAK